MDSYVRQQLDLFEQSLPRVLASEDQAETRAFVHRYYQFANVFKEALANDQLTPSTLQHAAVVLTNIRTLTHCSSQDEVAWLEIRKGYTQMLQHVLGEQRPERLAPPRIQPATADSDRESDEDFAPWRDWFLRHLHAPYPDKTAKTLLLAQVPRSSEQLNTWFTNTRRRSGWTDLFRIYGQSSERTMVKLLSDLNSPGTAWAVSREAKAAVERVRAYLTSKDNSVDTWMQQKSDMARSQLAQPPKHSGSQSNGSWASRSPASSLGSPPAPPPPYASQTSPYQPFKRASSPAPSYSSLGSGSSTFSMSYGESPPRPPSVASSTFSFGSHQMPSSPTSSASSYGSFNRYPFGGNSFAMPSYGAARPPNRTGRRMSFSGGF